MLEPVNTVLKAVKKLNLLRGNNVLVAGQGPIGLMFTLIGALLTGYGAINRANSLSLDININLVWGIVLLVFGAHKTGNNGSYMTHGVAA